MIGHLESIGSTLALWLDMNINMTVLPNVDIFL